MSDSACELVRTTTGMRRSRSSDLMAARTSRPPSRGRLRSSRIRSGRGASANSPWRRNRLSAASPLVATLTWVAARAPRSPSRISTTSPGLSSTSRISTGRGSACALMGRKAPNLTSPKRERGPASLALRAGRRLTTRQGEIKRATLARLGLGPDAAAVALDDLAADGQADAGAGVLLLRVQPLEDDEDALQVLRVDADAVVTNPEQPLAAPRRAAGADVDHRPGGAAELQRVADQVLEQLHQLRRVALDAR